MPALTKDQMREIGTRPVMKHYEGFGDVWYRPMTVRQRREFFSGGVKYLPPEEKDLETCLLTLRLMEHAFQHKCQLVVDHACNPDGSPLFSSIEEVEELSDTVFTLYYESITEEPKIPDPTSSAKTK